MTIALGIILIAASLFLIVAVLLQSSKSHRLSGTIAGGAETFFGKTKGSSLDKKLSKLTIVVAVVFVLAVLAVYLIQDTQNFDDIDFDAAVTDDAALTGDAAETTDPVNSAEVVEDTTAADVVTDAPAAETTGETAGE